MNHNEAAHHTGVKARDLAAQMTGWLTAPAGMGQFPSELVEWCRAARDVLAEVAAQAPTSYSPGHPAPFSPADLATSHAIEEHERLLNADAADARFARYAAEQSGMLI